MTTTHSTPFDHRDSTVSPGDVRAAYEDMREKCPVAHSDRYGGFDFISRYTDVKQALGESDKFSSAEGVTIPASGLPPTAALEFDEPEHSAWRDVLNKPLTLKAVKAFEPTLIEIADLLIDEFAQDGTADLVRQFTQPMPAIVVGRMVGLDQALSVEALHIADRLFASIGTAEFEGNFIEFANFTNKQLEDRRTSPRDDFLSQIASGVVEGMQLDDTAATGLLAAYLIGGHHSTTSGLSGLIHHALTIDGLKDTLVNQPSMLPRAIEESLRLTTPLQLFARTTRCPVTVADQELPEGERVLLNLAAANRDPRQFEQPQQFDLDRSRNPHLAFGSGIHVCQGQHLARAELRVAFTRLLDRLPDIRLQGSAIETGLIGGSLMTTQSLPVVFTPEAPAGLG
ncbi:cytochrome P450 [Rhodococcus ruber]|uniref:cytochrome P450 n=1 Tax=Rhodococcus TaxID=1827 RepID=UPI00029B0AD9|nr:MULTISPECIES: cytochrome P450 [Rhodococcus]ATQ30223.1 cytochrome P450 [Rhodococcus ruber]